MNYSTASCELCLWNPNQAWKILQLPRESLKIAQDPKQNPMESTTILDKMLQHRRQEARNLVKKYTSAFLSRLMQREGERKILWHPD